MVQMGYLKRTFGRAIFGQFFSFFEQQWRAEGDGVDAQYRNHFQYAHDLLLGRASSSALRMWRRTPGAYR